MNIPGLGDALKLVPAAQLPDVTRLLSRLPVEACRSSASSSRPSRSAT